MNLSHYAHGRDNNFNLIRVAAALAVLVSHSFALSTGTTAAEPLRHNLGMSLGSMAVDVFFIVSGFLITSSLLNKQSAVQYAWARVLRIFPGLLAMLLLSVFVIGALFTSLPLVAYYAHPDIYLYLIKCGTLITGVAHTLPGVFVHNPYPYFINSSLWTLPCEIALYTIPAIVWFALRTSPPQQLAVFHALVIISTVVAASLILISHFYYAAMNYYAQLIFMFSMGAMFYLLRNRIVLSKKLFFLLAAGLALSTLNQHVFFVFYSAILAYLVLFLAYVPAGLIRRYNRAGDYSYGIYLYAFPLQQSIAAMVPEISTLSMLGLSAVTAILLAILSWHLLEQRVLRLKIHSLKNPRK